MSPATTPLSDVTRVLLLLCSAPQALSIPVLANGNIRNLQDAYDCMAYTGADGVLSAESLLDDPALFKPERLLPGVRAGL